MKKISIIGTGSVGLTVGNMLHNAGYSVWFFDNAPSASYINYIDAGNTNMLNEMLDAGEFDICISTGPFYHNKLIAAACAKFGVAYFDVTEDVETTQYIQSLNTDTFMMPQCGLAPGTVNIVAAHLISQFDSVDSVKMRVGALPLHTNNPMAYYTTWSTSGLLNEYCNPADVLYNYKHLQVLPLDGVETVWIDGSQYEAFNTSGGVATMCDTYKGTVNNLSYKTLRYPGHAEKMKFLLDDLDLKNNFQQLSTLFSNTVPTTTQDVVTLYVSVVGSKNNKLVERNYCKKIYNNSEYSAIQLTTASGLCSVVDCYAQGKLNHTGFYKQEDVEWKHFIGNQFGEIFA